MSKVLAKAHRIADSGLAGFRHAIAQLEEAAQHYETVKLDAVAQIREAEAHFDQAKEAQASHRNIVTRFKELIGE